MNEQEHHRRLHLTAPLLVLVGALAVLGVALFFMFEALEERAAASASSELQAASLTFSSAEALVGTPLESSPTDLLGAISTLEGDHTDALHSLSSEDAARAELLLVGLTKVGHVNLHDAEEHAELRSLLDRATDASKTAAAQAEQRAAVSIVLALVTLTAATWVLVGARYRATNESIANQADTALRRRLETLLNDLPDMLFVFDTTGTITYRSSSVDELLSPGDRVEDFLETASATDRQRLSAHLNSESGLSEIFEVRTGGGRAHLEIRVTDLADDEFVDGYLVTARDISAELALRAELESQASLDALTELPNRRALDPSLKAACKRAGDASVGLLLVDFDEFKDINDSLGHLAGDQLLRVAASRMRSVLRKDEVLLRLGGDEFAVVLSPVEDQATLDSVGSRIRSAIGTSFELGETTEKARISIGAVMLASPFDADELLGKADIALYEAKKAGGDRSVVFASAMEERAIAESNIARALRGIDADNEFSLVYQPIVDASTSEVVSIEALLRWESPSIGQISPGTFIPMAERLGLMPKIGDWVLNSVCAQVAEWEALGLKEGITVSFNVSAQQIEDKNFVSSVFAAAERWHIAPTRLVAEITESMVVDHGGQTIKQLTDLRDGGVKISIDDFGSGYSNLGQMLVVPLDTIKIDRDLLLRLGAMREAAGDDPTNPCAIMEAIVTMARVLNAPVVCEGVETEDQRASLRASGVTYLQGYLLGRPSAPADLKIPQAPAALSAAVASSS